MKWNHSFKNIFSSSSLRLFVTLKKKEIRNYDVANKQSVIINITHSMNEKILVQIVIMDMKRIKISLSLCAGVFGFWRLFFFESSFLLEFHSSLFVSTRNHKHFSKFNEVLSVSREPNRKNMSTKFVLSRNLSMITYFRCILLL